MSLIKSNVQSVTWLLSCNSHTKQDNAYSHQIWFVLAKLICLYVLLTCKYIMYVLYICIYIRYIYWLHIRYIFYAYMYIYMLHILYIRSRGPYFKKCILKHAGMLWPDSIQKERKKKPLQRRGRNGIGETFVTKYWQVLNVGDSIWGFISSFVSFVCVLSCSQ